jgi:hypothetical protein
MAISEIERNHLHNRLSEVLGQEDAAVLMSHLPPSGWSDVVRTSDLAALEARMDLRFAAADHRFDALEARIDAKLAGVDTKLAGVDTKLAGVDTKLAGVDTKLAELRAELHRQTSIHIGATVTVVGLFTAIGHLVG